MELEDISQLTKIRLKTRNYQEVRSMEKKWTCYYLTEAENALISKIRADKRFQKLSDVSTINIGITTGNNKYFAVNRETAELYDLKNISVPLISKGTQIHSACFSEKDWECNRDSGKPVYLVNFPDCPVSQYTKRQQAWWYLVNGKVDFTADSVVKNNMGWWKVTNGQVDFGFTGIAQNQNGWWWIENGKVNFDKTGYVTVNGKIYYVSGGKVVKN